jgi:hypothetical protein
MLIFHGLPAAMPVTVGKIEELARRFRGRVGVSFPPLIERGKGSRRRRSSRSSPRRVFGVWDDLSPVARGSPPGGCPAAYRFRSMPGHSITMGRGALVYRLFSSVNAVLLIIRSYRRSRRTDRRSMLPGGTSAVRSLLLEVRAHRPWRPVYSMTGFRRWRPVRFLLFFKNRMGRPCSCPIR